MSMPHNVSLVRHLLSTSDPATYSAAIKHPFLRSAASGTLNHDLLALWLSQDRIYAAHAYPKFIGSLIANIPFDSSHALDSSEENLNQRILRLLVFSLENVSREVGFFKEISAKWGLKMEGWQERKGTRDYTAEMARISSNRRIEDGLVFLWAMEKVYLDAWSFIRDEIQALPASEIIQNPTLAAVASFAQNWSCAEFVQFVEELATLVDSLGTNPGSNEWERAEEIWARVVELEIAFWPMAGEESEGQRERWSQRTEFQRCNVVMCTASIGADRRDCQHGCVAALMNEKAAADLAVKVRLYRPSDYDAVRKLFTVCILTAVEAGSPGRASLKHRLKSLPFICAFWMATLALIFTFMSPESYRVPVAEKAALWLLVTSAVCMCLLIHASIMGYINFIITALRTDLGDIASHYQLIPAGLNEFTSGGVRAFWVAECKSVKTGAPEVVGCVGLDVSSLYEPGTGELRRLVVSPYHRRRGIAAALVAVCEARAKQYGFSSIVLSTTEFQPGARQLYTRKGYTISREWDLPSGFAKIHAFDYHRKFLGS